MNEWIGYCKTGDRCRQGSCTHCSWRCGTLWYAARGRFTMADVEGERKQLAIHSHAIIIISNGARAQSHTPTHRHRDQGRPHPTRPLAHPPRQRSQRPPPQPDCSALPTHWVVRRHQRTPGPEKERASVDVREQHSFESKFERHACIWVSTWSWDWLVLESSGTPVEVRPSAQARRQRTLASASKGQLPGSELTGSAGTSRLRTTSRHQ